MPGQTNHNGHDATTREEPARRRSRWRTVLRWTLRVMAGVALVLGLLATPMGCTTTIVEPGVSDGAVSVALLDHGRHASVVLPGEGDGMTRWAYGERRWYAEDQTGASRVLAVLLWPTQAALGRGDLAGPVTEANVRRRVTVPIEGLRIIRVERSRAEALHRDLDAMYQRQIDTEVVNAGYDLRFVNHPEAYSYFHNSNHVTAEWLERLGCAVRGPAFASTWALVGDGESGR